MLLNDLERAVAEDAALRRRQQLQPAGGRGDKIFPPTYPSDRGPIHVFERRRIAGEEKVCVLIDSVQSQANRMEEALLAAAEAGRIPLPRLVVDFPGAGLNSVGPISVLEAPHRIFDAILRDSLIEGTSFRESDLGQRLKRATPAEASAILEAAPTALLFGAWNSTGQGGGLGAKFARAITSEIIAIDVPAEEIKDGRADEVTLSTSGRRTGEVTLGTSGRRTDEVKPGTSGRRTGEVTLGTSGRRTSSRIDPLGIPGSIAVFKTAKDWALDKTVLGKDAKQVRPSEINHGNIAPSIQALGITCDYALQTLVLSFAGLRRLRFGTDPAKNQAARTYLAALGIVAALEADRQGRALRSRCDLVCEGRAPLEIVAADGTVRVVAIHPDAAVQLYKDAFDAACAAGFDLNPEPVMLKPQEKLVELVRRAQEKALSDEGGEE